MLSCSRLPWHAVSRALVKRQIVCVSALDFLFGGGRRQHDLQKAKGEGGKNRQWLVGQQSEINPGDLASPPPKVLARLQCWQTNSKGEGIHSPGLFCHSPRVRRSAWRRGTRLCRSTALRENPYSCGFLDLPFCCCRRDVLLLSQQHGDLPGQSLWRVGSWV